MTSRSPIQILPLVDLFEAGEHAQRGGLATPGGTDEDEELPVGYVDVELVDRGRVVARVDAGGLVELDSCHGVIAFLHRQERAGRSVVKVGGAPADIGVSGFASMPCRRRHVVVRSADLRRRGLRVVRLRRVNEPRSARLADIAAQADVSEATVSRVLNDRPGVSEPTRQAVLTAIDVLGYDRPTRLKPKSALLVGPGDARAGQPDLPGVRAGHRDGARRRGLHAGAVHPDPRWRARGRLRADAPRPRRLRDHLPVRPARRRDLRPGALPVAARARAADRARQRLARRGRRPVRLQRRRRVDGPGGEPPRAAGPHRDRAGRWARSATRR